MHIIEQAGRALYGSEWQGALADELDITPRALRRMVKGEQRVPDGIRDQLFALCNDRATELEYLLPQILDRAA